MNIDWHDNAISDDVATFIARHLAGDWPKAIAVPGGSTPKPILAGLATRAIDWATVAVHLTDDRDVPADHPASNFGLLTSALADTGTTLIPMEEGRAPPAFELVWIGMGADGHIASLFPNTDPRPDAPLEAQRVTPDPLPPEAPFDRITHTLPALARTRAAMLVGGGAEKRAVLEAAIAGKNDLPIARFIRALGAPLTIFWLKD